MIRLKSRHHKRPFWHIYSQHKYFPRFPTCPLPCCSNEFGLRLRRPYAHHPRTLSSKYISIAHAARWYSLFVAYSEPWAHEVNVTLPSLPLISSEATTAHILVGICWHLSVRVQHTFLTTYTCPLPCIQSTTYYSAVTLCYVSEIFPQTMGAFTLLSSKWLHRWARPNLFIHIFTPRLVFRYVYNFLNNATVFIFFKQCISCAYIDVCVCMNVSIRSNMLADCPAKNKWLHEYL